MITNVHSFILIPCGLLVVSHQCAGCSGNHRVSRVWKHQGICPMLFGSCVGLSLEGCPNNRGHSGMSCPLNILPDTLLKRCELVDLSIFRSQSRGVLLGFGRLNHRNSLNVLRWVTRSKMRWRALIFLSRQGILPSSSSILADSMGFGDRIATVGAAGRLIYDVHIYMQR